MEWKIIGNWYLGALATFIICFIGFLKAGWIFDENGDVSWGMIIISTIIFIFIFVGATCGVTYQLRKDIKEKKQEEKEKEIPRIDMVIKNDHKNYDNGADVFGVIWKQGYSVQTISLKNTNNNKSIEQLSIIIGFKEASVLYSEVMLENKTKGIRRGKDIVGEIMVKGPLDKEKKPTTKVMRIRPANIFNYTIEELYPEGSVDFKIILSSDKPQEIFFNLVYHYKSGDELKQAAFQGNMQKEEEKALFPNLKEINTKNDDI